MKRTEYGEVDGMSEIRAFRWDRNEHNKTDNRRWVWDGTRILKADSRKILLKGLHEQAGRWE